MEKNSTLVWFVNALRILYLHFNNLTAEGRGWGEGVDSKAFQGNIENGVKSTLPRHLNTELAQKRDISKR